MNNVIVPVERTSEPEKPKISQRCALSCQVQKRAERRAKRLNLIRTMRRWVEASPNLAEDERPHRLALLDRCEAQVDNWWSRPEEDQRAFDLLVARVRGKPLDARVIQSLCQQSRPPDDSLGAILKRQVWFRGGGRGYERAGHPRPSDHTDVDKVMDR